jgi:hypothetical protein
MVDKKNKAREYSARRYPSQSTKGSTQVGKAGVTIPVKLWSRRSRRRCYSEGNSDDGFSRTNPRWVMSSDEGL